MKFKDIFLGILLITIGVLAILHNTNVVSFSYWEVLALWPLILTWIGCRMLPIKDEWRLILQLIFLSLGIVLLVGCPELLPIPDKIFYWWNWC